jgi:hypothetical protein
VTILAKLETLDDELTALVKEERERRKQPWPWVSWNGNAGCAAPDYYGPRGTEFRMGEVQVGGPQIPHVQVKT